jgi:hypothetical protein
MKKTNALLTVLFALVIAACSDVPGETKLGRILQQQYDAKYDGLIEVNQVTKQNGWSESEHHYAAEVSYTIAFKKSFKAYMDEQTDKPGNPLEKMASGMAAGMLKLQYGDFKAGDKYQVKQQTLTLRMTENGWAVVE